MLKHSKDYNKILYKYFDIPFNFKAPHETIINMLIEYDYKRNDINHTILFLELMHDQLIRYLDK